MENIKFIGAQNEIQKIYSDLGLIVPVGDLSQGKAPAIQPLPTTSTTTSITAKFNVMSGGDITALSYKVNDGDAVSLTPAKGVVTITIEDLEYNSGPYEIELTATNEIGSTEATTTVDLQHYTNWASADEVLAGNKFIADGVELVGEIATKDSTNLTVSERTVTVPAGYYASNASASVSSDYIIPTGSTTISNNGTDINIAQYATVNVNVPVGPSTGGATVRSCTMETVQMDGMDIPRHTIVLDTMPEDIDPENHIYGVKVFALCYSSTGADPFSSPDIEHLADISGTERAEFDLENNTIYDYFCGSPQDQDFQDIASTSGYVVLYEDSFVNPIYKWPCTVITPTDSQQ